MNALANESFRKKKEAVKEAKESRDWDRFILFHEKPYRFNALEEIWSEIRRERKKAELFIDVWTGSENLWQTRDVWQDMIEEIPNRHFRAAMDPEDQETLDSFEYPLPIYRGGVPDYEQCWSWTTSQKTAEWFASRFGKEFGLEEGEVFEDVLEDDERIAFFYSGRGEFEVVVRDGSV